jgi:hypothetical protein
LQPLVDALQTMLLERGVLHADETPVAMLVPGNGKTRKAYIWSYSTSPYDPLRAVIYDFADGRAGHHARAFLGNWKGKLVCDDYAGYKALFEKNGVTEVGCLAHARRKFHEPRRPLQIPPPVAGSNSPTAATGQVDFSGRLKPLQFGRRPPSAASSCRRT